VLEGITYETQAILDSMCSSGLYSSKVDDMWNLFESLSSYQWQSQSPSEPFVSPPQPPYGLHAHSRCIDQFRDLCHHHSSLFKNCNKATSAQL